MRRLVTALAVGCVVAAAVQAQWSPKERLKDAPRVRARAGSGVPDGTGTVQYDPGAPADAFGVGVQSGSLYGNRFDTRSGSPLSFPGTITQISWYQGATPVLSMTALVVFGPQAPATLTASVIVTGVAPLAFNSAALSLPANGTFFAGFLNGAPTFASLGLRSASTQGQGFHGVQRSFFGAATNLPSQNAMVRVSGNVIIPVELLELEIE